MDIREPKGEDNERIEEILAQHNFSIPRGVYVTQAVVIHNGSVVAYGTVKIIAEEVLVMDKDLSVRQKAEVLELLHKQAIEESDKAGFTQLHAFVQDPHFEEVLKKHYGYKDTKGKSIVMFL